jgi:nitrogen fixation protein
MLCLDPLKNEHKVKNRKLWGGATVTENKWKEPKNVFILPTDTDSPQVIPKYPKKQRYLHVWGRH